MIDDQDVAELVKYAALLTLNTEDAVEVTSAAIRELEHLPIDRSVRRALLFRAVTRAALQRRSPNGRLH
jgi:hypothetical protein